MRICDIGSIAHYLFFCLLENMMIMNNMDMDNMNNIALYICGTYLFLNESEGGSNCMFHAVGDLDVVIGESSHNSLQIN